jgi:hypothetical protein
MVTKRTPRTVRNRKGFTPEILELYRRARMLRDQGPGDAYRDAYIDLHLALGRAPWDFDIFEALDKYRDTEITKEMIIATRGHPVISQWGLRKNARDLGLELEQLDRGTS